MTADQERDFIELHFAEGGRIWVPVRAGDKRAPDDIPVDPAALDVGRVAQRPQSHGRSVHRRSVHHVGWSFRGSPGTTPSEVGALPPVWPGIVTASGVVTEIGVFPNTEQRELFEVLLGVAGIGPKGALAGCIRGNSTSFESSAARLLRLKLETRSNSSPGSPSIDSLFMALYRLFRQARTSSHNPDAFTSNSLREASSGIGIRLRRYRSVCKSLNPQSNDSAHW